MKRILVLGGTQFVGRAIVEAALDRGFDVTVFHRGRHPGGFTREVRTITGDRERDLTTVPATGWDAVVDTSGYAMPVVRAAARRFAGTTYVFVSTIAVYRDLEAGSLTERSPTLDPDPRHAEWTATTYGPMKVACEDAVRSITGDDHLIVRPGIIVGPEDYTDRFPHWCRRVAEGGTVLVPGSPERPAQLIDARDLADWTIRAVRDGLRGTFNAVGPGRPVTLGGMLAGIRDATGSDARFVWADETWLADRGIDVGMAFPFHIPEERAGMFRVDARCAIDAGLAFRSLGDTVRDTLAWDATRDPQERRSRLAPAREHVLIRELSGGGPVRAD
jgi:2'-hydroxyisoflavone reductase